MIAFTFLGEMVVVPGSNVGPTVTTSVVVCKQQSPADGVPWRLYACGRLTHPAGHVKLVQVGGAAVVTATTGGPGVTTSGGAVKQQSPTDGVPCRLDACGRLAHPAGHVKLVQVGGPAVVTASTGSPGVTTSAAPAVAFCRAEPSAHAAKVKTKKSFKLSDIFHTFFNCENLEHSNHWSSQQTCNLEPWSQYNALE